MKIDIRIQGTAADHKLRAHALHRVQFCLGRFGKEVQSVTASFADMNGPKGGIDIRCRVSVRGPRLGTISLESQQHDAYVAIADLLDRTQRAVRRQLDRRRDDETTLNPSRSAAEALRQAKTQWDSE